MSGPVEKPFQGPVSCGSGVLSACLTVRKRTWKAPEAALPEHGDNLDTTWRAPCPTAIAEPGDRHHARRPGLAPQACARHSEVVAGAVKVGSPGTWGALHPEEGARLEGLAADPAHSEVTGQLPDTGAQAAAEIEVQRGVVLAGELSNGGAPARAEGRIRRRPRPQVPPRPGPGKGGTIVYVHGATATARLQPRLPQGRTRGPVFLAHRRAPASGGRAPAATDIWPITGRGRLSNPRRASVQDRLRRARPARRRLNAAPVASLGADAPGRHRPHRAPSSLSAPGTV